MPASRAAAIARIKRKRAIERIEARRAAEAAAEPETPGIIRSALQGATIDAPRGAGTLLDMASAGLSQPMEPPWGGGMGLPIQVERPPPLEFDAAEHFQKPGRYVMKAVTGEEYMEPVTGMEKFSQRAGMNVAFAAPFMPAMGVMAPLLGSITGAAAGQLAEEAGLGPLGQAGAEFVGDPIGSVTGGRIAAKAGQVARTGKLVGEYAPKQAQRALDKINEVPELRAAIESPAGADEALDATQEGYRLHKAEEKAAWRESRATRDTLRETHPGTTTPGDAIVETAVKMEQDVGAKRLAPSAQDILNNPEAYANMTPDALQQLRRDALSDARDASRLGGTSEHALASRFLGPIDEAWERLAASSPEAVEAYGAWLAAIGKSSTKHRLAPRRGAGSVLYKKGLGPDANESAQSLFDSILSSAQPTETMWNTLELAAMSGQEGLQDAFRRIALDRALQRSAGVAGTDIAGTAGQVAKKAVGKEAEALSMLFGSDRALDQIEMIAREGTEGAARAKTLTSGRARHGASLGAGALSVPAAIGSTHPAGLLMPLGVGALIEGVGVTYTKIVSRYGRHVGDQLAKAALTDSSLIPQLEMLVYASPSASQAILQSLARRGVITFGGLAASAADSEGGKGNDNLQLE
jgi:hypothetical protein